jgi:hypothetical protein
MPKKSTNFCPESDNEDDQFYDAIDNLEVLRGSQSNGEGCSTHKSSSSSSNDETNNFDFSKCNIQMPVIFT